MTIVYMCCISACFQILLHRTFWYIAVGSRGQLDLRSSSLPYNLYDASFLCCGIAQKIIN